MKSRDTTTARVLQIDWRKKGRSTVRFAVTGQVEVPVGLQPGGAKMTCLLDEIAALDDNHRSIKLEKKARYAAEREKVQSATSTMRNEL